MNQRLKFGYLVRISFILIIDKFAYLFSDETFLSIKFWLKMGRRLNLLNPSTFNEKIQWLKIFDRRIDYTYMVDKIKAKEFVSKIIGDKYIIPTYGTWNKFELIDFSKLPNEFVLKTTHDSGTVVICKNKENLNYKKIEKLFNKRLKRQYYFTSREWPYKNVKPQIIAEKLLVDSSGTDILDYKFMVFHGQVKMVFVCSDRESEGSLKVDFFDTDWNLMPFIRKYENSTKVIAKPGKLNEMIEIAEKISKNINTVFLRIDLYEVNNQVYFSEITFYPGGGWESFSPEIWDFTIGEWLDLNKILQV